MCYEAEKKLHDCFLLIRNVVFAVAVFPDIVGGCLGDDDKQCCQCCHQAAVCVMLPGVYQAVSDMCYL